MDRAMTAGVVESPAAGLLFDLQREGFMVELTADDALTIAPRSRLTPERMHKIVTHKDGLKRLLREGDDGVVLRRAAFEQLLARTPPPRVPAFLFRDGIVYAKGICFSCGDTLPQWTFGRCWRCALAWRLACRVPISAGLAAALDSVKGIA